MAVANGEHAPEQRLSRTCSPSVASVRSASDQGLTTSASRSAIETSDSPTVAFRTRDWREGVTIKRLERLASAVAIALTATLTVAAQHFERELKLGIGIQVVVAFVLVASTLTVFAELVGVTLLRWRWLRRALLRDAYVEGTWVDVVLFADRPPMVGIVHFRPDGASLRYSGENIDLSGRHLGHFRTHAVDVDLPDLVFTYGSRTTAQPFAGGMGMIAFDDKHGAPNRFDGCCLDGGDQVQHTLIGRRIDDTDDLRALEDPVHRSATALRLAAPLLPCSPGHVTASDSS